MSDIKYIGVQFSPVGRTYYFSVSNETEICQGMHVLVNTSRGKQLGKVVLLNVLEPANKEEIQSIERIASAEDLKAKQLLGEKEADAVLQVRQFLKSSRFTGVKAISAEYSFDSSRLTLFLNYEPESGFDIKGFLREVSHLFRDVRIDVRQVGPRDVAKQCSGLGACGIEKRCCSRFLTEFCSISIKMAKAQDISLTPEEITGMCGRLRCCLSYENEFYEEALKNLPKRKKVVQTPLGEGKVLQVLPINDAVVVELPEVGPHKFFRDELESGIMREAKPVLAEAPLIQFEQSDDVQFLSIDKNARPSAGMLPSRPRPERQQGRRDQGGTETKAEQPSTTSKKPHAQEQTQRKNDGSQSQRGHFRRNHPKSDRRNSVGQSQAQQKSQGSPSTLPNRKSNADSTVKQQH